jgi:putative N6-adenine-specific DNA methylase
MKLIAKTMAGLEELLATELEGIGATAISRSPRAVHFEGDTRVLYRANFELRTALRIIVPIADFSARSEDELYRRVMDINWPQYMGVDQNFAVDAVTWSETFRHSHYVALKTKDAIADRFRKEFGRRPNVHLEFPDLRVHVHINGHAVAVGLDSSGDSLHRRGYRVRGGPAPINEVLAAGMIMLSGWEADRPFVDPMCGSGTFVIEAGLIAGKIPPQWQRRNFGFMHWRDFQPELWDSVRKEALYQLPLEWPPIFGYDRDFRQLRNAEENIRAAHLSGKITLEKMAFERLIPPPPPALLMMNPPYDERLPLEDTVDFYKSIGDRFKQYYSGYDAWVISANIEALKQLGLKPSRKITLFNGPLEAKFHHYELYQGTKRRRIYQETDPGSSES